MNKTDWNTYYTNTPNAQIPWNKTGKLIFDKFFQEHTPPNKTILDVGCGKGWKIKYLQSLGYNVYGFDISEVAINQSNIPQTFVANVEDITTLVPIQDKQFGLILDLLSSQFAHKRDDYVSLLPKILTRNGYFILQQFLPNSPLKAIQKLSKSKENILEEFKIFTLQQYVEYNHSDKPFANYIFQFI